MSLIVFSHANSFGASTYRVMFEELRRLGHTVEAIDQLGHNPKYPVTNNWPHSVKELREFVVGIKAQHAQTPILIGHSLGGAASLMLASQSPELARGLIMMDSFVIYGWKSWGMKLAKLFGKTMKRPPASVALRRRTTWDSVDHVIAHLKHKRAFKNWDERVLRDYAELGTVATADGKRTLKFKREIEAKFYAYFPDNVMAMLRKHPLQCPFHFVGGLHSRELAAIGLGGTEKLVAARAGNTLRRVEGPHLFPMERPLETAHMIDELVKLIG
ncbi:MAG: alpha/beta hydrolase [Cytophagales bacterium]|nr:alpha/beta hydrolase [Cytophagales bacterium]